MAILALITILLIALFHDAFINVFKLLGRFCLWLCAMGKNRKQKTEADAFADLTEFIEQIEDEEDL